MLAAFCAPEASIAATNAGYEILRMIIIVGSLVIIAGMLPICIGGTAKQWATMTSAIFAAVSAAAAPCFSLGVVARS
jgi:hypothetical protein